MTVQSGTSEIASGATATPVVKKNLYALPFISPSLSHLNCRNFTWRFIGLHRSYLVFIGYLIYFSYVRRASL